MTRNKTAKPYTLVFDGDCGICTWSAAWVRKHDINEQIETMPYQSADLDDLSPGLTSEMTSRSVYFVAPDGTRYSEGRAVFETLKRLPGIYHVLGVILANPFCAALAWPCYRLVANNRTRISIAAGMTACAVPSADEAARSTVKNT